MKAFVYLENRKSESSSSCHRGQSIAIMMNAIHAVATLMQGISGTNVFSTLPSITSANVSSNVISLFQSNFRIGEDTHLPHVDGRRESPTIEMMLCH